MNKYQVALNIFCEQNTFKDISKDVLNENYKLLQELVNNPPLKFEDLHEGMWIWDDKTKSYIYIFKPLEWELVRGIRYASHIITNSVEGYYMDFEENRFYRREV